MDDEEVRRVRAMTPILAQLIRRSLGLGGLVGFILGFLFGFLVRDFKY